MAVMTLSDIRRHPVKGLGAEQLGAVTLTPGRALPGDRIYAIAQASGAAAAVAAGGAWVSCRNFVRPTTDPRFAQTRVVYDPETRWLIGRHPDLPKLTVDLSTEAGREALCDWVAPLAAEARGALTAVAADPARKGPAAHYADNTAPAVSVMSTASLAALSESVGQPLAPHRFRGNLWLDGAAPWAEDGWTPGTRLRIGATTLEVLEPIERCASPGANPDTGARDVEITKHLHARNGEMCFGVLAKVVTGGDVRVGDLAAVG